MFKKKQDKFLMYLVDFAEHLNETIEYFAQYKIKDLQTVEEFANKIKEYETAADNKVHKIIKDLNETFITPIEREDILQLTLNLDDIIDGMEEFTALLDIHQITSSDGYVDGFTENIKKCGEEILEAIELMANSKLGELEPHVIKIKDYERQCDALHHNSLKDLFKKESNPITVIQYKDIYETLEGIADDCHDVASTLQSIMMKNA